MHESQEIYYILQKQLSGIESYTRSRIDRIETNIKTILSMLIEKGSLDDLILQINRFYNFGSVKPSIYEAVHVCKDGKFIITIENKQSPFNVKVMQSFKGTFELLINKEMDFNDVVDFFADNLEKLFDPYNI